MKETLQDKLARFAFLYHYHPNPVTANVYRKMYLALYLEEYLVWQ